MFWEKVKYVFQKVIKPLEQSNFNNSFKTQNNLIEQIIGKALKRDLKEI
jgi:hypothetical protein